LKNFNKNSFGKLLKALILVPFLGSCANKNEFKSNLSAQVNSSFLANSKNPIEDSASNKNQKSIADAAIYSLRSNSAKPKFDDKSNLIEYFSAQIPHDNWWLEFNDQTLNCLVDLGLKNNKDIAIANAAIFTSRQLNNVQISSLLPSASIKAGRQRFASPAFGPNGVAYDIYQSSFDAVWELDLFGKNLDRARGGKLRFLKEVQLYKVLSLRISSEIARGYIELQSTKKQIENLQQIILLRQKISDIAAQKEKNGSASKIEIHNAAISVNSALAQLVELEGEAKILSFKLAVLIGETPEKILEILQNSNSNQILNYVSGVVPVGLKSDILRRRGDIIAAEYEIDAAVFDKKAQFKEFFPSVNLTATIGGGAKNLGDVFKDGANVKDVRGFVSVPIFQSGRLLAEYKISKTKAKIAVLNYEKTVLQALEECESQLVRYINSLQIETAANKQAQAANSIFQINQNKKRLGAINSEQLFVAQISALNLQNQFVQKKAQSLSNLIALHKAIGGGFEGYEMIFKKDKIEWVKK
jgi:multidrug efflux system outer membrane protein